MLDSISPKKMSTETEFLAGPSEMRSAEGGGGGARKIIRSPAAIFFSRPRRGFRRRIGSVRPVRAHAYPDAALAHLFTPAPV